MPMPRKPAARAILALAALALIWGYNWVIMKRALHDSGPFTFAALRALLGALALFALLAARRRSLRPAHLPGVLVLGLLQTTGFLGFVIWALVSGGAGRTAVLVYTMPLWLLVLAWPLLGERIRGLQWAAVAVAGAGLVLILQPWRLHAHVLSAALAVLGGVSWALAAIWAKHLRRRVHLDLLSLTAWQMLLGALPLILIAAWREPQAIVWTSYFTAVLATALAWLLWLYALDKLPAGIAGMGTLAVPLIGLAAAWLRLGERPSPPEAAGMALILTGLAILAWERLRRPAGVYPPSQE